VLLDDEASDEELEPEEPEEPEPDETGGWQQPSPSASTSHLPLSP
jgi:hypothetical protein